MTDNCHPEWSEAQSKDLRDVSTDAQHDSIARGHDRICHPEWSEAKSKDLKLTKMKLK